MDGSLVDVFDVHVRVCAECGDERPFERIAGFDGADGDEWACVDCGFAIFLDPVVEELAPWPVSMPDSGDTGRHAA